MTECQARRTVEPESAGTVIVVGVILVAMDELTERLDISVLAAHVKGLREQRGLDQDAVAERARVSAAYVSRLERGVVPNPKLLDLEKIAHALDVPVSTLVQPGPRDSDSRTMSFSADLEVFQHQLAALPPELATSLLDMWRASLAMAREARKTREN